MRTLIVGIGALGGLIAARLRAAGSPVWLATRNADRKKAAQAIVQLTQERNPPLRLLLGSDAYAAVEKSDLARLEEARNWKKLSVSTDFETK
jgi:ketopantoate reductase